MKNKNYNKNFCRSLFHYRSRLLFSGIVVASLPFVSSGKLVGKEEESTEQKAPPQNVAEEAREDNSSENSASDEESAEQKQQSLQGSVDSIDNDKGKTLERKQEKFESKFIIREDISSESAKEFLQFLKGGVTELDKVGASINAIEQNSLSQYIKKIFKGIFTEANKLWEDFIYASAPLGAKDEATEAVGEVLAGLDKGERTVAGWVGKKIGGFTREAVSELIRKAGESPETKENQKLLNSMEEYMREVTSEEVYEAEKIAEMLVPVAGEAAVGKIIGEEATATGNMVETVTKNVAAETRNLIESKPSVGENELEEGAGSGKILCRSKRTPGRDCIPIQEESSRSNRTAATTDGVVPNTVAAVDEGVVSKIVMLPSRIVSYFVNFINDAIEKTTGYESGGNLVPAEGSTIIREGFSQSAIRASGEQEPRGILTAKDGSQKVSGDVVRSGSTSTGEETSQVMHTTSPGIVLENEEEHQMVMRKKNSKRNRKKGTIKAITEETTVHDVRTPGGITEGDKIKETMDGSAPTGSSSLISPETTEVPHRDAALKNEEEYQMVMGGGNSKRNRKKGTVESITEKTTIHNVKTPGSITGGAVIHNARTPGGYARQFLKDHPDRDLKAMAKEIFGGEGDVAKDTQEYENAYHRPNHHKNTKVIKNLTINEGNGINYNVNLAPERLRHILERHHFVYFNRAYAMGKSAKSNLFAYGASPGDVVNTIEHLLKDNGDLIFAGKQSRSSRYFLDLQDTNRARYHIGFLQNSKDKVYVDQFYPLDTPEWEAVNAEIQSEIDHPISSSR